MTDVPTPKTGIGILRPLRHRDFRLLWLGQFISLAGDGIYIVAIAWQVYEEMGESPSVFAWVGVAWTVPQVLFLLMTGALSDRMDRRLLMIAGDGLRMVVIAAIGLLSIAGTLTIPMLLALVFVYGAGGALFGPAFNAIVPTIVPEELFVEANAVGQVARPIAMTIVGPLIGGLMLVFGTGWAFLADAVTFAISAVCVWLMQARPVVRSKEGTRFTDDIREGLRYLRRTRWFFMGVVVGAFSLFAVWGPWETLVPFVVKDELGGDGLAFALVLAAGGLAAVTVGLVMAQRSRLGKRPLTVMYAAWAVGMGATAGFGLVTTVWQAMLVAFVAEGAIAMLIVIWFTVIQRLVPDELRGRVSSLDWMISIGLAPLSFAVVGPIADAIGTSATLILAGVVGAVGTLTIMYLPGARDPERDGSLADPEPSAVAP